MKRKMLVALAFVAVLAASTGCPTPEDQDGEPICTDLKGNRIECPERWDNKPLHGPVNWGMK
jgi:hypothetical protein